MKVQYQIMEVDENHLKKVENSDYTISKRLCFVPAKFKNPFHSNLCDSFEDALNTIEKEGNDFTEYTVIPRIYKTNYED